VQLDGRHPAQSDDGTTWECARVAATGRRRLGEALLEREEGEARVAFF
jgi:hypothetical protein